MLHISVGCSGTGIEGSWQVHVSMFEDGKLVWMRDEKQSLSWTSATVLNGNFPSTTPEHKMVEEEQ